MSRTETIIFRCRGRSDRSETHLIEVARRRVACSCMGTDWCSHIDATLIAGERHMVPDEDRIAADRAMTAMRGLLHAPEGWQASWREDRVWRGLAAPRSGAIERQRFDGRPTIAFMGSGDAGNRSEYAEQAVSLGWRVVEKPVATTTIVVASTKALETDRGRATVALGVPVLSHEAWSEWCYDFTNAILDRIEEMGFGPDARTRDAA